MKPSELFNLLNDNKITCFSGVPDSLLKDFCAYITDNAKNHTITANEGNAIALASGHYLASGNPAAVYMQNSGIGNCVNPLLSLTDEEVYKIPLLMFIGWRGEPNQKDEPQHIKQGKVTDKLLDVMGIKYEILPENFIEAKQIIQNAINYIKEELKPFAFIVKKGTFEKYELKNKKENGFQLQREDAIKEVVKNLNFNDIIVSTTGHISRELYEIREKLNQSHKQDFLTVGSMGHASSIALGIALEKPNRNVFVFDGDGAFLMHEGSLTVNASKKLDNFKHIVFNNIAHDSVGGQPTANYNANLSKIALNSGYKRVYTVKTKKELQKILPKFINQKGTILLEIKVKQGARKDLGRPKEKPYENKKIFMENINQVEFIYKGAIENLSKIIKIEKAKKVLVFTGKKSFEKIKPTIEKELKRVKNKYYNDFSTNPKMEEVEDAIKKIKKEYDLIVAIGGGSVIDFAKAFKYQLKSNKKLIAIPTTAGTGSEATQFSVIYVDGTKTSLDNLSILPDYSIVDSQFIEKAPKKIRLSCALDAFCQAIESYWAIKSTLISRSYAQQALELCKGNLVNYINNPNVENSKKMMKASNLAGKAINISRTTLSHALSYKITTDYQIPHGKAVAMTIRQVMKANYSVCKGRINEIKEILKITSIDDYFVELFNKIGFDYSFKNIDIKQIVQSVNLERLKNNPKVFTKEEIEKILKKEI